MTEHSYYHDSYTREFEADLVEWVLPDAREPRVAAVLNRTFFYPTSGGQPFDTGVLLPEGGSPAMRVTEVAEDQHGRILHYVEGDVPELELPTLVHGSIDRGRRRDHMQQHTGQHILSAAFIRAFNLPTLSFHLGADFCSIDVDANSLSAEQLTAAERLANEVVMDDRALAMRFAPLEEARTLGLRKVPDVGRDELRLIEIPDFDLTACGGTHVRRTGEVGCILLRKVEKVKQGMRVSFVCGSRAVTTARCDYAALTDSAGLFSAPMWDLPQVLQKSQDEARAQRKSMEKLLEELAALEAEHLLADAIAPHGVRIIVKQYANRDAAYLKLLAQRLMRNQQAVAAVALLASTLAPPTLVFAQTSGLPHDMGAMLKALVTAHGGRGGGTQDLSQGGVPDASSIPGMLADAAAGLQG